MATLGTPTKDESGRLIQRWYPQAGDIRPAGLEYQYFDLWYTSHEVGHAVTQDHCDKSTYRIPSTYTPPDGWYCVGDEDVVQKGDALSHDAYGKEWKHPNEDMSTWIGSTVAGVKESWMPNGGWVLRREPVGFPEVTAQNVAAALQANDDGKWEAYVPQIGEMYAEGGQLRSRSGGRWVTHGSYECSGPDNENYEYRRPKTKAESCKSESAEGATVPVKSTTDIESGECGSVEAKHASNATEPVAWQFVRRPMERVESHRVLLKKGQRIEAGDSIYDIVPPQKWIDAGKAVGMTIYDGYAPVCRPVYAPLPTRLEDVPDGRCFTIAGDENRYWKSGTRIGSWNHVDGCVDAPTERELWTSTFTITDYVAELKAVS